jgi:two-component system, LytTR family, response regulator LytT
MKIVIVEDERVAARRLERLTREVFGDRIEFIHCFETLAAADEFLGRNEIDLLLLDLNLNGADGFELLSRAVAESFYTIVVSATTDRAIQAYEYGVVDFVPKPYDQQRLRRALERLDNAGLLRSRPVSVLVVKNQGRLQPIYVQDILFLQGAGDYAEIHCRDGSMALHNKSLEALESMLPLHFVRIHKSYILDLREVVNLHIHGGGKYRVELKNGKSLPVSRTRYKEVTDALSSQV